MFTTIAREHDKSNTDMAFMLQIYVVTQSPATALSTNGATASRTTEDTGDTMDSNSIDVNL